MTRRYGYAVFLFLLCMLIALEFSIAVFANTTQDSSLSAETSNSQVYLTWSSYYGCHYEVLRSEIKGGYFSVVKSGLIDPKWVDTVPETEKTYYYKIVKYDPETHEEKAVTQEVSIYVP